MKKIFSLLTSAAMVLSLAVMPTKAEEVVDNPYPWTDDASQGTAVSQGNGWYVLTGEDNPTNMKPGPQVDFKQSYYDEADFSKGFMMSVKLDYSKLGANAASGFTFAITGTDGKFLDETAFHFESDNQGKVKLDFLESNKSGREDNTREPSKEIAPDNEVFDLAGKFTRDENGKLLLTYIVNNEVVASWSTNHDYSKVKGPRCAWLFETDGNQVLSTLPTVQSLGSEDKFILTDNPGTYVTLKDGNFRLLGNTDPSISNLKPAPKLAPIFDSNSKIDYGFEVNSKVDLSLMKTGEVVSWSFGLTGTDGNYLDEAVFHFGYGEKPQLNWLESNSSGSETGKNIAKELETPLTSTNGVFDLTAKFTPNKDGKLVLTFVANGKEVGSWATIHDYSDVKGPRYGWAFECKPVDGIVATSPKTTVYQHKDVHTIKHVAKVEPTYEKEGNIEYWFCEVCKKYFSDEALTKEIKLEDTIIAKLEKPVEPEKGEEIVEAPEVDPEKPVEEVTVGVEDKEAVEETLKDSTSKETQAKIDEEIAKGNDVVTEVVIGSIDPTKADETTKKDITVIDAQAKESKLEVAEYLDLSILVKVVGGDVIDEINKTSKPLTFQIAVPEELKAEGRTFVVIRVHEGKVTELKTTEKDGILSFETDQFSTYALAYSDEEANPSVPWTDIKPATPVEKPEEPETPDTSDNNLVAAFGLAAMLSVAILVVLKKKESLAK